MLRDMVPRHLQSLFQDVNLDTFVPEAYPDYSIFRVLEWGDEKAVAWMRQVFPEVEVRRVLLTERRLSPKSATFWALIYKVPPDAVAALRAGG